MEKWLHMNASVWRFLLKEEVATSLLKKLHNLSLCSSDVARGVIFVALSALHNNFAP